MMERASESGIRRLAVEVRSMPRSRHHHVTGSQVSAARFAVTNGPANDCRMCPCPVSATILAVRPIVGMCRIVPTLAASRLLTEFEACLDLDLDIVHRHDPAAVIVEAHPGFAGQPDRAFPRRQFDLRRIPELAFGWQRVVLETRIEGRRDCAELSGLKRRRLRGCEQGNSEQQDRRHPGREGLSAWKSRANMHLRHPVCLVHAMLAGPCRRPASWPEFSTRAIKSSKWQPVEPQAPRPPTPGKSGEQQQSATDEEPVDDEGREAEPVEKPDHDMQGNEG